MILAGFGIEDAADLRCDVIEPLEAGQGVTVSAAVGDIVTPELDSPPALPERRPSGYPVVGLAQLLVGALTAGGVFAWFRRRGSNEVFGAGGAADATFLPTADAPPGPAGISHELPVPALGDRVADVPTYSVPAIRLAELATIEFVPPRGVDPWQGNVLLSENVSDQTVSAWFSEMVAQGAIELDGHGKQMTLRPGQSDARLSAVDRGHLSALFRTTPAVALGAYDKSFAGVWKGIRDEQRRFVRESGWWRDASASDASTAVMVTFGIVFAAMFIGASAALGLLNTLVGAVLLSLVVTALIAGIAYSSMLASRIATGSALTLRTESFRRFLEASEGRHVDWAWEQGLIREYSAWAVALGAADAWSKAIESSNLDEPDRFTTPLLIHTYTSTMTSSHTAPSSSGGSGGGGGVGGGGGGGSSGSW